MPVGDATGTERRTSSVEAARTAVLIAAVAGAAWALAARRLGDFDLPWHLAFGRVMAELRSVPSVDPLALSARPIEHAEVVSELLLWAVYRVAGPLGLQLLGALVATATTLVLYRLASPRAAASPAVVALAFCAISPWLVVRPAIFSFLFLAVELWLLDRHRRDPARQAGALLLLAPLATIWANAHGFVVVGVLVGWTYVLYRAACRLAKGRLPAFLPPRDGRRAGQSVAIMGLVTVASCLSRAGPKLLLGPVRAAADFGFVTEWARPDAKFVLVTEPATGALVAVVLVALVAGRDEATASRVSSAFDVALVALAIGLGASAVRLIPVGAVLVVPIVSRRLGAVVPSRPWIRWAAASSAVLAVPWLLWRADTSIGVGFEPRNHPEGAVRWIEEHRPVGNLWNFSPYGGYLSLRLYPAYRVLIDGRTGWVHDPELTARARRSEFDVTALRDLVSEFRLEWAVSRAIEGEPFGAALAKAPEFVMVYLDDVSAVYVVSTGPNAKLAAAGYRRLRHLDALGSVLHAAVRYPSLAEDVAHDGALAFAQAPSSPRAAFLLACGRLAVRDRGGFERALTSLRQLAPGHGAIGLLERAWVEASGP